MSPHRIPRLLTASLLLLTACSGNPSQGRPSVILVLVDTLRADRVGGEHVETPGIDRIATEGVAFSQAFSHAPMTLPAHTSLFSSRAPFETGVFNNWQPVRTDLPLLAEWLDEAGYQTRAVVSLGTLNSRADLPALSRGFDDYDQDYWNIDVAPRALERMRATLDELDPDDPFFLFLHFSDPHDPYNSHLATSTEAEILLDGEPLDVVPTSHMTQVDRSLALEAGEHVFEVRSDDLFKLRSFLVGQHDPRVSEPVWEESGLRERTRSVRVRYRVEETGDYQLRLWISDTVVRATLDERYEGEVRFVDEHIGLLVDELRARGLWDAALVVFTSDHGEALGEHGHVGHVQNLYEEQLHVPLIVKLPAGHSGEATLRAQADRLVPHMDVVPTILDVLTLPGLPGQRGSSLLAPREPLLYAETHVPEAKRTSFCIRDERFKLIFFPDEDRFELYDLVADPAETEDVLATLGDQRPDWPDRLRSFQSLAGRPEFSAQDVSDELREQLEALGYAGE